MRTRKAPKFGVVFAVFVCYNHKKGENIKGICYEYRLWRNNGNISDDADRLYFTYSQKG